MTHWLLLIHQLPPQPPYLRAKIAQRLAKVGALPLKNSVYVLPERDECQEDFEWIAKEAVEGGGQAWIAAVDWLAGTEDEALRAAFLARAEQEYAALAADLRAELGDRDAAQLAPALASARTRIERAARRDFFEAPARAEVEAWLRSQEEALLTRNEASSPERPALENLRDKVWVTRRGVYVDRIATAWLVRRFVDPQARFRFVAGARAPARAGEIRFDLSEAEVTHEGDRCTFEVLLGRLGLDDPALRRVAEIVHDIDLKDERYDHPETAGLERMLGGLVRAEADDLRRLERGGEIFEALYRGLTSS
ncbi:MAG TPA: chromate resistance protein ChrB domain-containing protein [Thermoanaerobaculia bacterium]|nr:chromate resistance protein ChrB domain-containing protein [Thermoanaerobaculia bacterium]